ncbi:MAG: hypothetical protein ACYDH8_14765 [Syntrophales bacterium]
MKTLADNYSSNTQGAQERLVEFGTLRTELLSLVDLQARNQLYCITLVASILSYSITNSQPWPCLLGWFLTIYFWRDFKNHLSAIHKIGRYIAEFLEPESIGLRWEHRVARVERISGYWGLSGYWGHTHSRTSKLLMFLNAMIVPHAVLSLSCVLATLSLALAPHFGKGQIILVLAVALLLHSLVVWRLLAPHKFSDRENWAESFKKLKAEEDSQHPPAN